MSSQQQSEKTAEQYFQDGLAFSKLGDDRKTFESYKKAIELDPDYFLAHFNLGIRYGKLRMNLEASKSFREALRLKPEAPMVHYSLAVVSNFIGEMEEAFKHYNEAIRINPEFGRAHSNIAMLYYGLKYGKETIVLKGTNKPYTGTSSSTISIWKDVVIKWSFVDGQEAVNPRTYYSQLTGEKLSGEFKTYYPGGTKHGVINLVDGKQVGTTKTWYPNGNLKSTFNYSMGIEDGVYSTFYENGNKKQTGIHGPNKTIQWTDWYINGQKESFNSFNGRIIAPIIGFG